MGSVVETVEAKLQDVILAAIGNIITPSNKLAVKSMDASNGRDAANISAISERRKRVGMTASSENVSKRSTIFHELIVSVDSLG